MPTSHMGQTIVGSPHRLPTGSTTAAAGNGGGPTSQSVPTPAPALANVGIELNEVQPGELCHDLCHDVRVRFPSSPWGTFALLFL